MVCIFVKQMMAQPQATTKTVVYDEPVSPLKQIGTKDDLRLQPNPAYDLSCKAVTDAHPVYENC